MTTLRVRVQSYENMIEEVERKVDQAALGNRIDSENTYTFSSWAMLHKTLSPTRIEIIRAMTGQGAMSVREVARRVGRDVKNVHGDLEMLTRNGVIEKTADGVIFPYDRIHVEFDIETAA